MKVNLSINKKDWKPLASFIVILSLLYSGYTEAAFLLTYRWLKK